MAEATRNAQDETHNAGDLSLYINQNLSIAADQDTWTPGLRAIVAWGTSNPAAVTKVVVDTTGTIPKLVFTAAGAPVANFMAWALGYP